MLASAATGLPRIPIITTIALPPPSMSEQEAPNKPLLQPLPVRVGNRCLRTTYMQRRSKTKAETQEMYEQRRESELSPCSLRSGGINPHNQLGVSCISGIPEETTNHP